MAFVKADRVQETSTTTGTGAMTLAGAYSATYRTFASVMSNGDTCQYLIINEDANNEWEIGEGTYSSSTLTRNVVLSSSNSNAAVTFTSGDKRVAMLPPASAMVVENNSGDAEIERDLTLGRYLVLTGSTSGATTVTASATASGTLTLPAATDQLVGRDTTDTLTNKSMSGSANTFTNLPATGLSGQVPVANGGTGASTLTDNGVLYGNATAPVGATAEGSTGQLLIGSTGNPPGWQSGDAASESTGLSYTVADLAALKALTTRPPVVIVETGRAAGACGRPE